MPDLRTIPSRMFWPAVRSLAMAAGVMGSCAAQESSLGAPVSAPASPMIYPQSVLGGIEPIGVPLALIFFPPEPPPLDAPVAREGGGSFDAKTAPAELGRDVNEFFYAPLSSHLQRNDLSERIRRRLEAYRAARDELRSELKIEITRTRYLEADARERALAEFARQQAPRLATQEATAEELRHYLVDDYYGWFALRQWTLGSRRRGGDTLGEIADVMQAYAFFHKGLRPVQRGLLREISMEILRTDDIGESATAGRHYLLFSPEMARVELPERLPEALAAKIAEYDRKKSAVKKELYDLVFEKERASIFRGGLLRAGADRQTAALAALEHLADEIRRELARLPGPGRVMARSALPPELVARAGAGARSRAALQAETRQAIEEICRQVRKVGEPIAVTYDFEELGLVFEVTAASGRGNRRGRSEKTEEKLDAVRQALRSVADAYHDRVAEITRELSEIRRELEAVAPSPAFSTADATLKAAMREAAAEEHAEAYRDYRTAVFEPGLSPEQRRLLFGDALMQLRLPLPPGEIQPTHPPR